jgi:hypothetical protein
MALTRIPESEALSNPAAVFARARAGEEIIVESSTSPETEIHLVAQPARRSLKETIARIRAHDKERGCSTVMDEDFANDLREIIANRKPRDTSAWD